MTKELFLGIRRKEQIITIETEDKQMDLGVLRDHIDDNVFKRKRRKYATLEQRLRNIEQSMQK